MHDEYLKRILHATAKGIWLNDMLALLIVDPAEVNSVAASHVAKNLETLL